MADKAFNPFEHHHHHHDHDHDEEPVEQMDPGQRALADALRVSFFILKILMLALLVYYFAFSGIFTVGTDESAIRLRFGRIVKVDEQTGQNVLDEGVHFAWPYPIEQVVKIPRSPQTIELRREYWFWVSEKDADKLVAEEGRKGPLNPALDGSMLTGDANIAHARWTINYKISSPDDFITNVADPTSQKALLDAATRVVKAASESAVIYTVAQTTADELQKGQIDLDLAVARAQATLDELRSGIEIEKILLDKAIFPMSVRDDFRAVNNAESERATQIEEAIAERDKIIGETAGEGAAALLALIGQYELATDPLAGDKAKAAELEQQLDKAITSLRVPTPGGEVKLRGRVAELIESAHAERAQTVDRVKAEAERFTKLLPEWQTNPGIVRTRLWALAIQDALTQNKVDVYYIPLQAEIRMILNKDPLVEREDEQARLIDEREREQNEQDTREGDTGR